MKIGEIKVEALKLMFAAYDDDYNSSDLTDMKYGEAYRDYLINMPGSIKRAFGVLERRGVLPPKSFVITGDGTTYDGVTVDMSEKVEDFLDVDRVSFKSVYGEYYPTCPYSREGDKIMLSRLHKGDTYTVFYRPKISREYEDDTELSTIGIPDRIAELIPYFIKSELYCEEDPEEATRARSLFDQGINELIDFRSTYGAVQSVFGMG
ncbi:MAG: hypothetical protein IKB51_03965 [Clostridia bacterium]|nr:hypothetical protein [Clostridia bacterium]